MHHFEFDQYSLISLRPDGIRNMYSFLQFLTGCNYKCLSGNLKVKQFAFPEEVQARRKFLIKFMQILFRTVHEKPYLSSLIYFQSSDDTGGKFENRITGIEKKC